MSDFSVLLDPTPAADARPVHALTAEGFNAWLEGAPAPARAWAKANGFEAGAGKVLLLPGSDGAPEAAVLGLGTPKAQGPDPFLVGALHGQLPAGAWRLEGADGFARPGLAALGWVLGAYRFDRYKSGGKPPAVRRLAIPELTETARAEALAVAEAVAFVRDLVNTPAGDLGPAELAAAARALAKEHGAAIDVVDGAGLAEDFPLVEAVGRASARPPCLIDLTWGPEDAPRLTLVGKGVCFDTGGLNLKPGNYMLKMKKDMGGGAHVLGFAKLAMTLGLKVRLRVLVPAVENAVSGSAFRPGDVLPSRSGQTVEIGNTDAEGRLILADALTLAGEEEPDLLIDFATLTGAARQALGPEVVPFYTDDDAFAAALAARAEAAWDPVWRMPLWAPYDATLDGKVGAISHIGEMGTAGSITAALFLKRFVPAATPWAHFDIYAWNDTARPARPAGGEAQGLRALWEVLAERYGTGA